MPSETHTQTPVIFRSISQAVPAEIEDRLIELGERISRSEWEIGVITNTLANHFEQSDLQVDRMRVYAWVAARVGRSARTVRWYAQVTKDAPFLPDLYPLLRFAHFAAARRISQDNYLEILDIVQAEAVYRGSVSPPVDWMDLRFGQAPTAEQINAELDVSCARDALLEDRPGELSPDHPMSGRLSQALNFIDNLAGMAASLPVPAPVRRKLLAALETLQETIREIQVELSGD